VLEIQVIPSNEYADTVDPAAIATNLPLPQATLIQFAVAGKVVAVQVSPSLFEYAATLLLLPAIATHIPIDPYARSFHVADTGRLVVDQVSPLVVDFPAVEELTGGSAINLPLPYATDPAPNASEYVPVVHTDPSAEYAIVVVPEHTATKNPRPNAILEYVPAGKVVPPVQEVPSIEYTVDPVSEIAKNLPFPNADDTQLPDGKVADVATYCGVENLTDASTE